MKHNWEYKPLANLCSVFVDGDWIESKDQSESGIRLIQTGNVGCGEYLDKSERSKFISEDTFYSLNCTEIFEGDILISRLPDPIGRACILPELTQRTITAVDVAIVRPNSSILPKLIVHYTKSKAYASYIDVFTKGSTRKRVSRKNLGSIKIPVPPMAVQEQIVEELDEINGLIEKNREVLRNLDALAQSLFYNTFGDPISNPKGWGLVELSKLCNIVGRIGFRGYTRQDLVPKGEGAITLSPSNIVNGRLVYDNCTYISWFKYEESPEIMVFDGDVIFTKTGSTVGKVGVAFNLPEKATINPQLVVFKNLSLNNWYTVFILRDEGYQLLIKEKAGGSAVPTMSQKILGTIKLPVPPLVLQEDFAAKIEAIEAQKAKVETAIAQLQTLLDSRMDYWFN